MLPQSGYHQFHTHGIISHVPLYLVFISHKFPVRFRDLIILKFYFMAVIITGNACGFQAGDINLIAQFLLCQ